MIIRFNIKPIRKKEKITLKELSHKTGISTTHLNDIENNNKMPSMIFAILIAKELRVNQRTISNWEVGERQPTLDTLEVIAKYFNVSYDYLLGLTDE